MASTAQRLAASFLLSFAGFSAPADEHPMTTPDDTYQGVSFGDRTDVPDFVIVAGAENINGKVAVCGLVFFSSPRSAAKPYEPQVTQKLKFYLNGQKLMVQTGVFRRYSSEEEAMNGGARCAITKVPWQKGFDRRTFEIKASDVSLKLS